MLSTVELALVTPDELDNGKHNKNNGFISTLESYSEIQPKGWSPRGSSGGRRIQLLRNARLHRARTLEKKNSFSGSNNNNKISMATKKRKFEKAKLNKNPLDSVQPLPPSPDIIFQDLKMGEKTKLMLKKGPSIYNAEGIPRDVSAMSTYLEGFPRDEHVDNDERIQEEHSTFQDSNGIFYNNGDEQSSIFGLTQTFESSSSSSSHDQTEEDLLANFATNNNYKSNETLVEYFDPNELYELENNIKPTTYAYSKLGKSYLKEQQLMEKRKQKKKRQNAKSKEGQPPQDLEIGRVKHIPQTAMLLKLEVDVLKFIGIREQILLSIQQVHQELIDTIKTERKYMVLIPEELLNAENLVEGKDISFIPKFHSKRQKKSKKNNNTDNKNNNNNKKDSDDDNNNEKSRQRVSQIKLDLLKPKFAHAHENPEKSIATDDEQKERTTIETSMVSFFDEPGQQKEDSLELPLWKDVLKVRKDLEILQMKLSHLLEKMRHASIDVLFSIKKWRDKIVKYEKKQHLKNRFQQFRYDGHENYLLKMCCDLVFLDGKDEDYEITFLRKSNTNYKLDDDDKHPKLKVVLEEEEEEDEKFIDSEAELISSWIGFKIEDNPLLLPPKELDIEAQLVARFQRINDLHAQKKRKDMQQHIMSGLKAGKSAYDIFEDIKDQKPTTQSPSDETKFTFENFSIPPTKFGEQQEGRFPETINSAREGSCYFSKLDFEGIDDGDEQQQKQQQQKQRGLPLSARMYPSMNEEFGFHPMSPKRVTDIPLTPSSPNMRNTPNRVRRGSSTTLSRSPARSGSFFVTKGSAKIQNTHEYKTRHFDLVLAPKDPLIVFTELEGKREIYCSYNGEIVNEFRCVKIYEKELLQEKIRREEAYDPLGNSNASNVLYIGDDVSSTTGRTEETKTALLRRRQEEGNPRVSEKDPVRGMNGLALLENERQPQFEALNISSKGEKQKKHLLKKNKLEIIVGGRASLKQIQAKKNMEKRNKLRTKCDALFRQINILRKRKFRLGKLSEEEQERLRSSEMEYEMMRMVLSRAEEQEQEQEQDVEEGIDQQYSDSLTPGGIEKPKTRQMKKKKSSNQGGGGEGEEEEHDEDDEEEQEQEKLEESTAAKIQSVMRMHLEKKLHKQRVFKFEQYLKKRIIEMKMSVEEIAIISIQAQIRGFLERKAARIREATFLMEKEEKRLEMERKKQLREEKARIEREHYELKDRGRKRRQELEKEGLEREKQRAILAAERAKAAKLLSRQFHQHIQNNRAAGKIDNSAATTIQRTIRKRMAKKSYDRKLMETTQGKSAVKIQSVIRGHITRIFYDEMKFEEKKRKREEYQRKKARERYAKLYQSAERRDSKITVVARDVFRIQTAVQGMLPTISNPSSKPDNSSKMVDVFFKKPKQKLPKI